MRAKCPKCGSELHPDEKGRAYCVVCGREYFVCLECGEVFTTIQGLAGHAKKHKRARWEDYRSIIVSSEGLSFLIVNDERTINAAKRIIEGLSSLNMDDNRAIILLLAVALARLEALEEAVRRLAAARPVSEPRKPAEPLPPVRGVETDSDLPSFARGNPWIRVLSEAGRHGGESP